MDRFAGWQEAMNKSLVTGQDGGYSLVSISIFPATLLVYRNLLIVMINIYTLHLNFMIGNSNRGDLVIRGYCPLGWLVLIQ